MTRAWRRHAVAGGLTLAAFAAVAALYMDRGTLTTSELDKREGMLVTQWRRADVGEMLVTQGGTTFTLKKVDGDFRLRAAPRVDDELADTGATEALLAAFDYARPLRNASDDASLGFSPPRASVRVHMTRGSLLVELGRPAPAPDGAAYARVDGGKPVVVARELAEALLRPMDAYRDKRIVPYVSAVLGRVEVGTALRLERAGEAPFRLTRMSGVRPQRDRLARFWVALVDVRAESFLEPAAAEAMLGGEPLVLRLEPKEPTLPRAEIVLGGGCGEHGVVAVRRTPRPVAACVPAAVRAELATTDAAMADRGVATFHADEVSEISLRAPPGAPPMATAPGASPPAQLYDWARAEGGFRERAPRDRVLDELENAALRVWLEALLRDESSRVAADLGAVQGAPSSPVTLVLRAGGHEESVLFEATRATRTDDGATMLVSARLANLIAARSLATTPPLTMLTGVDAADVNDVKLACDGTTSVAHKTATGYAPAGVAPDAVQRLIGAVLGLRQDTRAGFVALADDGASYGLVGEPMHGGPDTHSCTVHLSWRGGHDTTLTLGAAAGGEAERARVYAKASGQPGVFTVPAELRVTLARGFRDRD